jgi:hypothetical protein
MREILGSRFASINGIWLPANQAIVEARRSVVSLHSITGDENWPTRNLGTAFLYQALGRRFCVFTRHQVQDVSSPDHLCVHLSSNRSRLFPGTKYINFYGTREEDDLCVLEMPRLPPDLGNGSPLWFQDQGASTARDVCEKFFVIGYPSKLAELSGEDRCEGIALSQVLVWSDSLTATPSQLPMLSIPPGLVMLPRCGGDYDGFSGAPVFGLSASQRIIRFLGIVIRGGRDRLFFIPTPHVNYLCQVALQEPTLTAA